jgi:hypothetical protein
MVTRLRVLTVLFSLAPIILTGCVHENRSLTLRKPLVSQSIPIQDTFIYCVRPNYSTYVSGAPVCLKGDREGTVCRLPGNKSEFVGKEADADSCIKKGGKMDYISN